jgi:tetratricopeptide (TPR) repeat protein
MFQETFKIEEPDSSTYYYIGECYEKLEEYPNAEKNYLKAIKIDDYCADAFAGLAVVNEYQNKDKVAIKFIKKAIDLEITNSEFWYIYGDILAKTEDTEEAVIAYYKVLELDPDNEEVWLDLSEVVKKNESIDKAILFLYEGLEKQPENYAIYTRLAALLLELGKTNDAVDHLNIALTANKKLAEELIEYYPNAILFPSIVETLENYK